MAGVIVSEQDVLGCCASTRFAQLLAAMSPFPDAEKLIASARHVWWNNTGVPDWLQAFHAHPKIGEKKPATTTAEGFGGVPGQFSAFSAEEQAAAERSTTDAVATELRSLNASYLEKFGFIFIICARGRPAPEILAIMKRRIVNTPHEELFNAAREQMKITELRLRALPQLQNQEGSAASSPCTAQRRAGQVMAHFTGLAVQPAAAHGPAVRSPITTHVLDTATGRPAVGLPLSLQRMDETTRGWEVISGGVTNEDGRVGNLLPSTEHVPAGRYRMVFDTSAYLLACAMRHPSFYHPQPFYPEVAVDFVISADIAHEHFHIPLLLSPYGFSTYRGS